MWYYALVFMCGLAVGYIASKKLSAEAFIALWDRLIEMWQEWRNKP